MDCETAREQGIQNAQDHLESTGSSGREQAYIEVFDETTGEVDVRTGNDAANRTGSQVTFVDQDGKPLETREGLDGRLLTEDEDGNEARTNMIVLVTAHNHPRQRGQRGTRNQNTINEDIENNPIDQSLSRIAPAVIKTPSGRIRRYHGNEEF